MVGGEGITFEKLRKMTFDLAVCLISEKLAQKQKAPQSRWRAVDLGL
jgi:hypothetical protein